MEKIRIDEFRSNIKSNALDPLMKGSNFIVTPKEINTVRSVHYFPHELIATCLRAVNLECDPNLYPYQESQFSSNLINPDSLLTGQRFYQPEKCETFFTTIAKVRRDLNYRLRFDSAIDAALRHFGALIINGIDQDGDHATGIIYPPIVEAFGRNYILRDGTHRAVYCLNNQRAMPALFIYNPTVEPPTDLHSLTKVKSVEQKPPVEQRYLNLKPQFFRNLNRIGLDG